MLASSSKWSQSRDGRCAFLLPQFLDDVANQEPGRVWFTIPNSPDLESGWRDITFAELNRAVNGFAKWIERRIGAGKGREVMAYVGYELANASRLTLT
jgi:acyl-CoA synthetase (AMP-forming)/AMP-acid ligase II